MDTNPNNSVPDFSNKSSIIFSENSNASRDGSSNNGCHGQWHETRKDHRRDHGKNRERGRDERNLGRSYHGKSRDNFRHEESRKRSAEEQPPSNLQQLSPQQPTSFSAYNYNSSDPTSLDNNRRAVMMSTYNTMTAFNPPWGVNPMDGMTMSPNNLPVNHNTTAMPMVTGMEMNQAAGSGMNPYAYVGMSGDNNMFGMMGMGNYCQYGMMNGQENLMVAPTPIKEVVQLTKSVLYPPNPNVPPPTIRDKPEGCRTVFVGGLPEKVTDEIIKEVFERCGEIQTIRKSSKNFCHIRFASEIFVEHAIYYSGYIIKIENKDEAPFTGRLHVDYAQARDDQYEFECQQRALQRETRHRERLEEDFLRPPTPPPVVHYSEHEAAILGEKLRGEETFHQAVFVLITWLERGECNKRNAGSFYSMIQSTNSQMRRLQNEKLTYEDDLNKARMTLNKQKQGILLQFTDIIKVYNATSVQKVWDHFTKAQRKNIDKWKKETEKIKNAHVEEVLNDRIEDEMDLSEDEDKSGAHDNSDQQNNETEEQFIKHQEEIDSARCQFQGAVNEKETKEAELLRNLDEKVRQVQALEKALEASTIDVQNLNNKCASNEAELEEYRALKRRNLSHKTENDHLNIKVESLGSASTSSSATLNPNAMNVRLISLISTFLHVHPFGASIDYICSYLHQINPNIQPRDVENLMRLYPETFREDSTGIGASLGKKWKYLGFQS